ncbi:MAG: hypothetical protein HYV02_00370 [Deltaproteobacteria bacterium]|nr:hypothetical protein [Deltaproteobacteria bacterium]
MDHQIPEAFDSMGEEGGKLFGPAAVRCISHRFQNVRGFGIGSYAMV